VKKIIIWNTDIDRPAEVLNFPLSENTDNKEVANSKEIMVVKNTFCVEAWLSKLYENIQMTPTEANLGEFLIEEGFTTTKTVSLLDSYVLDRITSNKMKDSTKKIIIEASKKLIQSEEKEKDKPTDIKSFVSWLDPDLSQFDSDNLEKSLTELFGKNAFSIEADTIQKVTSKKLDRIGIKKLAHQLLILEMKQNKGRVAQV